MRKLDPSQQQAAITFLKTKGRLVDRQCFAHRVEGGLVDSVLKALASYQNADGGFGHSLEPDACLELSSALDTSLAFRIFRRLKVDGDSVLMVRQALDYLRNTFDSQRHIWPIKPVATPDSIGAPWWQDVSLEALVNSFGGCVLNPSAELLGVLIDFGDQADQSLIDGLTQQIKAAIQSRQEPLEMHDLLCVGQLVQAKKIDPLWRQALVERLQKDIAVLVQPDPATWEGYGLKPWWVATGPDDPVLDQLEVGLLDAMLDHEIGRQQADGSWAPFWDWGHCHSEHWPAARLAWQSMLTEQMLDVLERFDRLENG